jgi:hypothetical protein
MMPAATRLPPIIKEDFISSTMPLINMLRMNVNPTKNM